VRDRCLVEADLARRVGADADAVGEVDAAPVERPQGLDQWPEHAPGIVRNLVLRELGELATEGEEGPEVEVVGAAADEGNAVGYGVQGGEQGLVVRDVVLEGDVEGEVAEGEEAQGRVEGGWGPGDGAGSDGLGDGDVGSLGVLEVLGEEPAQRAVGVCVGGGGGAAEKERAVGVGGLAVGVDEEVDG